jgi:hypothetical protein
MAIQPVGSRSSTMHTSCAGREVGTESGSGLHAHCMAWHRHCAPSLARAAAPPSRNTHATHAGAAQDTPRGRGSCSLREWTACWACTTRPPCSPGTAAPPVMVVCARVCVWVGAGGSCVCGKKGGPRAGT